MELQREILLEVGSHAGSEQQGRSPAVGESIDLDERISAKTVVSCHLGRPWEASRKAADPQKGSGLQAMETVGAGFEG